MSSLNKKFPRLLPEPIRKGMKVADLIDCTFKAYNGGRLAEACRLFTTKMIAGRGVVGMSLTGALTPAGLGRAAIVPLMKAGFVSVGIQALISNGDGSNSSASTRFISIIGIRIAAGFLFSGYGDRVLPF